MWVVLSCRWRSAPTNVTVQLDAGVHVFRRDAAKGALQPLGQTPTEKSPRGFAIDPSGRFLVAPGQESHSMSVHPTDPATGELGTPKRFAVGKNPNWVEIVDLP